jgi:hypothetical protein
MPKLHRDSPSGTSEDSEDTAVSLSFGAASGQAFCEIQRCLERSLLNVSLDCSCQAEVGDLKATLAEARVEVGGRGAEAFLVD